jgi:hypothetical protein
MFKYLLALAAAASLHLSAAEWKSLFNGKDLTGWEQNKFGGAGEIKVENGQIVIASGVALTGIRRTNDLLRSNYEVDLQAMKQQGNDFFCGLTFPVKDSHATLVVGGCRPFQHRWNGRLRKRIHAVHAI